jgi:hypothetical protein
LAYWDVVERYVVAVVVEIEGLPIDGIVRGNVDRARENQAAIMEAVL